MLRMLIDALFLMSSPAVAKSIIMECRDPLSPERSEDVLYKLETSTFRSTKVEKYSDGSWVPFCFAKGVVDPKFYEIPAKLEIKNKYVTCTIYGSGSKDDGGP